MALRIAPSCLSLNYNCMPVNPATGLPFPGNMIPTALQTGNVGQVAVKNGFWQTPTIANQPEGAVNYINNVGFPLHQNQQSYRGDQNLGKYGSVFFRYTDANYSNQGFLQLRGPDSRLRDLPPESDELDGLAHHQLRRLECEQLPLRPPDCKCTSGRPADHIGCCIAVGFDGHLHDVYGSPANLAQRWFVTVRKRRWNQSTLTADRTAPHGSMPTPSRRFTASTLSGLGPTIGAGV